MAGAKETTRQKMIGMMYLVLTALLALNISKEVLNGFVKVENSLLSTQATLNAKVNETNSELETKYSQNQEKVQPFRDQAQIVNKQANDLIAYITELKARSMAFSAGDYREEEVNNFTGYLGKDASGKDTVLNLKHIKQKDEYMALTEFMVGGEPESPKEGAWTATELKQKMVAFSDATKAISFKDNLGNTRTLPEHLQEQLDEMFEFGTEMEDGKEVLWEAANFYDVPLAAVMPLMTKMTLDIQDIHEDILAWLLGSVDAKAYKFTNLLPLVVPESNYILRGDTFRADVLLAAFDGTNPPDIFIDSQKWNTRDSTQLDYEDIESLPIGADGLGKLRISTKGMALGDVNYKGLIRFQGPDGNVEPYAFYTPSFTVAEPALVVSPTKMNVFYRGVPNPVEVSVPGVPGDKLEVRISGDNRIKKQGDGTYIVEPGKSKEAKITVSATMPDGSKKTLPASDFRVKRIPDPVPSFAGKTPSDRTISKNTVLGAPGVSAKMQGFDFDVKVTVKSFSISVSRDGALVERKSNSNRLTSDMSELLKRVGRGNVIYIEDIVVSMPDGTERQLAPMKLKVA
ncbi:MAG: gliding motility protein GldM [Flavobacteriales bacterium]|jgi:gliding motility-associated protein GldM|nr:gliding motility protein GldM [Flavobacteriales bacterium]